MEELFGALHEHRSAVKIAFRWYALVGGTGADSSGMMNSTQFVNFVKGGCDLLDDKGPVKFITSDVDLIYKRSIREVTGTAATNPPGYLVRTVPGAPNGRVNAAAPAADGADQSAEWKKTKAAVKATSALAGGKKGVGNLMAQAQFVAGLLRLSSARYPGLPTLAARLRAMCDERLTAHVTLELDLVSDTFSQQMAMQPMGAVLRKHEEVLTNKVFAYYAGVDKSLDGLRTLSTMNVKELQSLCEDAKVFKSGGFSLREMVNAFARVNIEDDLFEQADKANTSTELVFDEFFEVLARMYRAREWATLLKAAKVGKNEGLEFARGFHRWLADDLVPTLLAAIKLRKKENK